MNKKIVLAVFLSFFLSSSISGILFIVPVESHPAEIIVPDDYEKIQWAIGNASDGDTIFVRPETYYEYLTINKSISLIGQNRDTTVIDGKGIDNIINITADHVNITGFTIRNGTNGIFIDRSDYNIISGNVVTDNQQGIHLFADCVCNPASNNTIRDNLVKNNSIGIRLQISMDNVIYHNNFISNIQQVGIGVLSYTNFWDDGYPSGGNHWSDHACTGNPSDGSQPYTIDKYNIDQYPFQDPNGWINTLKIYSSPSGVTFTVDNVSCKTPWSESYNEGASVNLVMPETHDGYVWSIWYEDGDTNRTKTVIMNTDITLTAVYTPTSPVGGIYIPANKLSLLAPYIGLTILLAVAVVTVGYVKKRKRNTEINS